MQRGFSLVELSIVLVILGLLTGGILAGQSLIRASELRAVTSEYQRYVTATQTFRDKYFAIPGDFNAATRFWNRQVVAADCVTNSGTGVAAPGACDGNGGGTLDSAAGGSQSSEMIQYWRQLAHAGLIEGSYSGLMSAGSATHVTLGMNVPASKFAPAGWFATYSPAGWPGGALSFAGDFYNHYMFGGAVANSNTFGLVLKPEELWNIDTKMDDGRPGLGKVLAGDWDNCTDATSGSAAQAAIASYALSTSAVSCFIYFVRAF